MDSSYHSQWLRKFMETDRENQTLGGISHNNASAIPLPSSAMKRSNSTSNFHNAPNTTTHARSMSGSRMSLAPGRPNQPIFQRSSSGTNLADMGANSVQRNSGSNAWSSTGGRKSYAPVNATPASSLQLQQSTQRRSSVYSARHSSSAGQIGHQSFFAFAPQPAGVPRDPRPLKDRTFQAQIGQDLMDFLTHNNYEMEMKTSLRHNTMSQPTQRDFELMFQWLYHRIDPSYMFRMKIDAEVPQVLKQLRYPYERSITKSALSAVGGTSWPTFLGMLHWLMQLAKMSDQFAGGAYDDAPLESGVDVTGDKIAFEFLSDSYRTWLSLDDDMDDKADEMIKPHIENMSRKFDEANSKYLEQVKMLEGEHRALQDQIDELSKTGPKISKLEEQIKILEEDRSKFENYNSSMEAKVGRSEERATLLRQEIERTEGELRELDQEKEELQGIVDRQGITVQDIDRMNTERERLQKGLESANQRLEETKDEMSKKETDAGQRLESLEHKVHEYNSMGYRVAIIPETAVNAKGTKYELSLLVNQAPDFRSSRSRKSSQSPEPDRLLADASSGYQPQHLLSLDMKGKIKSSIVSLRKQISERRHTAAEDDMEKKEVLDQSREALEEKQQEVETLGHRIRAAEEELEKTREVGRSGHYRIEAYTNG